MEAIWPISTLSTMSKWSTWPPDLSVMTSTVKSERGQSMLQQENTPELNVIKYGNLSLGGQLPEPGNVFFFPSINTYEQIRWACSLAPIALGPQHRRPNTPRWSRCPWSLETTWECTSATRILSAACVCNIWRQKVTAVLEFTRVKRPCGAF